MATPSTVPFRAVEDLLPGELWCRVFEYLTVVQLRRVRLTCARWKRLVDGDPTLMNLIALRFPNDTRIDAKYRPKNVPPARNAKFYGCTITSVEPWWPEIGPILTGLSLTHCYVSIPLLLNILRRTPNLKRLKLDGLKHREIPEDRYVNFQLEHLEELTLVHVKVPRILNLFKKMRAPLKKLVFNVSLQHASAVSFRKPLLRSVLDNGDTLEELRAPFSAALMEALPEMHRLRLKRVWYSWGRGVAPILGFCQLQPALEELDISELSATDLSFREIASLLPNLRRFSVRFEWESTDLVPSFLDALPHLEALSMEGPVHFKGTQRITKFGGFRCPALKQFRLVSFTIPSDGRDLYQFFASSSQIRSVTLDRCKVRQWSELVGALKQLPNLQRLELNHVWTPDWNDPIELDARDLRHLELSYVNIPEGALIKLLSYLPKLEKLELKHLKFLNDHVVCKFCLRLPKLAKLTVSKCPISNRALAHINLHCKALEQLDLRNIPGLSQKVVDQLKDRVEIVRFAPEPGLTSQLKEWTMILVCLALLYYMFQWYGFVGIALVLPVLFVLAVMT